MKQLLRVLGGLMLLTLPNQSEAQVGKIRGSMPRNGAKNIVCTVFISAGYVLPDSIEALDIYTLNDSSVRLFPQGQPDSPVAAFVSLNKAFKTIIFEPHKALMPLTTYIFEVTDAVRDEEGQALVPYHIEFRTGEKQLPKFITMARASLPPRPDRAHPAFEAPKGYAALAPARRVWLSPAEKALAQKTLEARKASVQADPKIASPAKPEEKAPAPTKEVAKVPSARPESVRQPLPETDSIETPIPEPVLIEKPAAPKVPTALAIRTPTSALRAGQGLPYEIDAPEAIQVQYIVKAQGGNVVKRGTGAMEPGYHKRVLPLTRLKPGKYRLSIKIGERMEHHVFSIR